MRMTFEEASRQLLAQSRLRLIAEGEIPATAWNWQEGYAECQIKSKILVDKLCKDLSLLIGRPVWQAHPPTKEIRYVSSSFNFAPQAQWAWGDFINFYPAYIKKVISNLRPNNSCDNRIFSYPISPIYWRKGCASFEFPNEMDDVTFIKLTDPVVDTNKEIPPHIQNKLELLEKTEYDYKPYILRGKEGIKVLAINLGREWNDIAIATFNLPKPTQIRSLNNVLICLILCFMFLSGAGLYLQSMFENFLLRLSITVVAAIFGSVGILFLSLFVAKRYRPLKV